MASPDIVIVRPKCDGGALGRQCRAHPAWKVRNRGDSLERNWLYACGRHLNQVARDWAPEAGTKLDLVRVRSDD